VELSPDPAPQRPIVTATITPSVYLEESYSPWETLIPKTWFPSVSIDPDNSVFGVELDGDDALGQHSYRLNVQYETDNDRIGYTFGYSNRTISTPIFISSALFNT